MEDIVPGDDAAFALWLESFNALATAHLDTLGLSAADLTPCINAQTALTQTLADLQAAEEALQAAIAAKNAARTSSEIIARVLAYHIHAKANISEELRRQLGFRSELPVTSAPARSANSTHGITGQQSSAVAGEPAVATNDATGRLARSPRTSRSATGLWTPLDLVATAEGEGLNVLRWEANGNRPGTVYVIEAAIGADVKAEMTYRGNHIPAHAKRWAQIAVTKATEFLHSLGECHPLPAIYRVRAKRGDMESGYSNESHVYYHAPAEAPPAGADESWLRKTLARSPLAPIWRPEPRS